MRDMKFLDLFAGIGGFRLGLTRQGHECIGFCEIDKFARKSYKAIYETKGEIEFHDIRQVTDQDFRQLRGQVDIICGGFPCQAFSLAGRRLGFEDTRGTLFFEIARAAKQIQPRFLFLENVKGLLSHDKGETFRTILTTLDELGMMSNGRCLTVKISKCRKTVKEFLLSDILEDTVPDSYFLSEEKTAQLVLND